MNTNKYIDDMENDLESDLESDLYEEIDIDDNSLNSLYNDDISNNSSIDNNTYNYIITDMNTGNNIKISNYKLATMTVNVTIPIIINLKVIGLYLEIDEYIKSIRLENYSIRGDIKVKRKRLSKREKDDVDDNKKKKTAKKTTKKKSRNSDFDNQCTINCRPYGNKKIDICLNMKIFPNGKIGITGVKSMDDAKEAVNVLLRKIDKLEGLVIYPLPRSNQSDPKNLEKKLKTMIPLLEKLSDYYRNNFRSKLEDEENICLDYEMNINNDNDNNNDNKNDYIGNYPDWNNFMSDLHNKKIDELSVDIELNIEISYMMTIMTILSNVFDLSKTDHNIMISYLSNIKYYDSYEKDEEQRLIESYIGHININLLKMSMNIINGFMNTEPNDSSEEILNYEEDIRDYYTVQLIKIMTLLRMNPYFDSNYFVGKLHRFFDDTINKSKIIDLSFMSEDYTIEEINNMKTLMDVYQEELDNNKKEYLESVISIINPINCVESKHFSIHMKSWTSNDNIKSIFDVYNEDKMMKISNINTSVDPGFFIDQEKILHILTNKYKITKCDFEKTSYNAINCKFISTKTCPIHKNDERGQAIDYSRLLTSEHSKCVSNCKNKKNGDNSKRIITECCKDVSLLIFNSKILITGGRNYEQIDETYRFICEILCNEYDYIKDDKNNLRKQQNEYPNFILSDNNKFVKKDHILDNPKNVFIIKKLGLIDKYTTKLSDMY